MRIIGLTGGIASGKSTVTNMLRELGARVVDTDAIAREIVAPGRPAWEDIVAWLGRDILLADGGIDRAWLGELVFRDNEARKKLEGMTHPRIAAEVKTAVAAARQEGLVAVVLDVPLLFEAGWDKDVDEIWVVYVDAATQADRLMARDGLTPPQARARMAAQADLAAKARRADVVIDNAGDTQSTREQVVRAWRRTAG